MLILVLVVLLFLGFFSFSETQNLTVPVVPQQRRTIVVGIAAVETLEVDSIGWPMSGGAVNFAIQRLKDDGYCQNFDFLIYVNYTECDRGLGAAIGLEFMRNKKVDVMIGPPCQNPMEIVASMSSFYQVPLLGWGMITNSKFTDSDRYPYLTTMNPDSLSLGYALAKLLEMMEWDRVALLYEENSLDYSLGVINDVETAISDPSGYNANVVLKLEIPLGDGKDAQYITALNRAKSRTRVIISSIITATSKRKYLQMIMEQGMISDEYVHIFLSLRSVGLGKQTNAVTKFSSGLAPVWEMADDDELNAKLRDAAKRLFVLDMSTDVSDKIYSDKFNQGIGKDIVNPPVSCQTDACRANKTWNSSAFSRSLHDSFYDYGMGVSNLYNSNPADLSDTMKVINAMQLNFQGLTGEVTISKNNSRDAKLMLYAVSRTYDQISYMNISYTLDGFATAALNYKDESELWYWYGGTRPLSVPICGYLGTDCPKTFVEQYGAVVFTAGSVLIIALILLITSVFYISRQKKLERDRINRMANSLYQTDGTTKSDLLYLVFFRNKIIFQRDRERQSKRSLQSGPSNITDTSKFTFDSEFSNYTVFYLDKDPVLSTKHPPSNLFRQDYEQFVKLRKLDHDNINKFIGMSINGADYYSVWKMCMRGSLQDIIVQGNFSMDPFFMFCIIRDIAEGMKYLHSSFLHVHANLRSATCLVNESWQVKITDYGIGFLLEENKPTKKRQLWQAPEVLRDSLLYYQIEKPADVYSFSIICSEILTRKPAWNLSERRENVDELVYLVKKGGPNPLRPDLDLDGIDVNTNLLHLVRDCWSEEPQDRPNAEQISDSLRKMMPSKKTNLMDHVFNILEEYTSTLELEVEERTKELSEEKKKADILLGRMLPKQVAERLKQGQTVEPEGFDSVTVFFSDVVKFTQLAAKCSPFQVVNLLNDLYSNFDAIIEEHGVYKVESIGDGYLCVSGLPVRNGYAHIKQIIELSLDFMSYVSSFKVPHLPREKVELRIGVNSGPCVAGVVGLSMPRYCLFGDTVNTASRMESNGKASHVHMSAAAHTLLVTEYPNEYETESRGDVIIKGKGVMETFWVHVRNGENVAGRSATVPTTPPMENIPAHVRNEKLRRQSSPYPESPTMSKRSVSPIIESKAKMIEKEETEALYRQFKRQETLAIM